MPINHLFLNHDPDAPPPHPGPAYTRFVCLSDTHSRLYNVPPGDVLLHAGDLSSWGRPADLKRTVDWLKSLPHPVKILVAGNHDLCLDKEWGDLYRTDVAQALVRGDSARKAGIHYLEHESMQFTTAQGRTWRVYGSPAAPRYAQGSFQYETAKEARDIYAQIPLDTEILLTHTPPYEIHDVTKRGKNAGCRDLAARLQELRASPAIPLEPNLSPELGSDVVIGKETPTVWNYRLHVWGHIHEAYGGSIKHEGNRETVQVNAALENHGTPVIVDLHNGFDESVANVLANLERLQV